MWVMTRVEEGAPRFRLKRHKDVHVESGDGFEIERRTHRAADGVAFDDAVGLHLVNRGNGFFDVHPTDENINLIPQPARGIRLPHVGLADIDFRQKAEIPRSPKLSRACEFSFGLLRLCS
jgi:hypothetical protein